MCVAASSDWQSGTQGSTVVVELDVSGWSVRLAVRSGTAGGRARGVRAEPSRICCRWRSPISHYLPLKRRNRRCVLGSHTPPSQLSRERGRTNAACKSRRMSPRLSPRVVVETGWTCVSKVKLASPGQKKIVPVKTTKIGNSKKKTKQCHMWARIGWLFRAVQYERTHGWYGVYKGEKAPSPAPQKTKPSQARV